MSSIYIATIVSLGLMGAGYGYWNDNLNLDVSITTGNINGCFNPTISYIEGLCLSVSGDGRTLYIEGEVHPGFNQDISVEVINDGTIPFIFEDRVIGVNESISYPISISVPASDLTTSTGSMESFGNSVMTMGYDESAIIAQQIQEIDELIQSLDVTEYYGYTEELEIEQGLGN